MIKLSHDETELIGEWLFDGDNVEGDDNCSRIKWLTENILEKVAYSREYGAWETLYVDKEDGRYWAMTYPKSHMHGGGPPALKCISVNDAHKKYDFGDSK